MTRWQLAQDQRPTDEFLIGRLWPDRRQLSAQNFLARAIALSILTAEKQHSRD
jgi:hypothetical protein